MTRTAVMFDPRFAAHEMPPGHPERADRIRCLTELVDGLPESTYSGVEPRLAKREEVSLAHGLDHWDTIAATAHAPVTALDPDTFAGPHSFETARLAAGGTLALLDAIVRGDAENGFALVRPPGHHAERDRAMGFCLFNHVAIGAAALRARGFGRVAIVDWDVHHGNGTQDIFWRDARVLYASLHQWPLYPGTGHASEIGEGPGLGTTLNVPITEPWGDAEYVHAMRETILPALREFGPDFLLVSAGYDIDGRDPLGGMRVTPAGFAALTGLLRSAAAELCGGRLALVLEGGYHLDALREGVAATLEALASPSPEDGE